MDCFEVFELAEGEVPCADGGVSAVGDEEEAGDGEVCKEVLSVRVVFLVRG